MRLRHARKRNDALGVTAHLRNLGCRDGKARGDGLGVVPKGGDGVGGVEDFLWTRLVSKKVKENEKRGTDGQDDDIGFALLDGAAHTGARDGEVGGFILAQAGELDEGELERAGCDGGHGWMGWVRWILLGREGKGRKGGCYTRMDE